jgi:hypothetical protein
MMFVFLSSVLVCARAFQERPHQEERDWRRELEELQGELRDPERARQAAVTLIETLDEISRTTPRDYLEVSALLTAVRHLATLEPEWLPPDFDVAQSFRRAIEFALPLEKPDVTGMVYVAFGQHLLDRRRSALARALLREGIERIDAGGGRLIELDLMLAGLEGYLGNYEESWRRIQHAEHVLYGGGGRSGIARSWVHFSRHEAMLVGARGELHYLLGNLDLAAAELARERALAATIGSSALDRRVALHSLDVALALGRLAEVERLVAEELSRSEDADYSWSLGLRGATARAESARAPAELEAAVAKLEELLAAPGIRPFDRVRVRLVLATLQLRQGRFEDVAKSSGAARLDLAAMENDEGCGQELALSFAALDGALAAAGSAQDVALLASRAEALVAAFRRWLERWDRTPSFPSGVGFLSHGERGFFLGATLRLTRLASPGESGLQRALDLLIEAQARGSIARRAEFRARPFAELRRLWTGPAEERRGVLVYVPGPERTELFAFDARRLVHAELPGLAEIDGPRTDLEVLLSVPPDAAAAARGRAAVLENRAALRLAELLLPGAVHELIQDWKGVTVVGLELLGYVPFEFLPLARERFLGDGLAVAYLPSLPLGAILAERPRASTNGELLVVAATEVAPLLRQREPALEELPFDDADARRWMAPWARSALLRGAQGARNAWAEGPLASAAETIVLAHGVHDRDLGPGLALAPSKEGDLGLFWPVDALETRWTEHVWLASCGAGRATLRRGEDGVTSFAGSILAAGARSVVLGPGPQALKALLELGERYQKHLAAGASPAEALRRARGELPGSLSHPFYSSLHVIGLGHEPILRR